VFDDKLVSRFHLLSDPDPLTVTTPPVFMAFDLLHSRGRDLGAPSQTTRQNGCLLAQTAVSVAGFTRALSAGLTLLRG
jgi:hypothetical protein